MTLAEIKHMHYLGLSLRIKNLLFNYENIFQPNFNLIPLLDHTTIFFDSFEHV